MRASDFYIKTLRESPAEAELPSHRLMLRAGMIHRLASGLYTWMPLGLRSLRKVERVVREEMNRTGAVELAMPMVQPAKLWQESQRWIFYGKELLRIKDRHDRDFCFGPTHEEVITDIVRQDIQSYKDLPKNFYQIQTKFRDEVRPRFGVMRAREFVMKDAYSFHVSHDSLCETYQAMYDAYAHIFSRLGLKFRAVAADTGSIGGTASHEFHVLAASGEDAIAFCPHSDYAANVELAEAIVPAGTQRPKATEPMCKQHTPEVKTIPDLVKSLGCDVRQTVKAIVVDGVDDRPVLLLIRGDHTLNEIKTSKLESLKSPLQFSSTENIIKYFGAQPGSLGPIHFQGRVIADRSVAVMADMIVGANETEYHYTHVNWGRDCPEPIVADIRNVLEGDPSPDGHGSLEICRGIEVGHVFQLRTKYSEVLGCQFLDPQGQKQAMEMGCYGIGVSRIVAAAIEQNFDEKGICLPETLAPFSCVIVPIGYHRQDSVRHAADQLYKQCLDMDMDILLDDRPDRPGVLLADSELIGIPHRLIVSERHMMEDKVEYQPRLAGQARLLSTSEVLQIILCGNPF